MLETCIEPHLFSLSVILSISAWPAERARPELPVSARWDASEGALARVVDGHKIESIDASKIGRVAGEERKAIGDRDRRDHGVMRPP